MSKAPNKIYLAFDGDFVAQSANVKEDANGHSIFLSKYEPIEYVRKDALLEWAKEKMTINLKEAVKTNNMFTYGIATVFGLVIDKLNSL